MANIQPPKGFEDRKPDVVLCTLGPTGPDLEYQAKLFTLVLWSIDSPTQAQIRVRRDDTHEWATNQGINVSWMAAWLPG